MATRLIGRDRELDEICALLVEPDTRFLTLTGPGGVGKTSLALAAAERLRPAFDDDLYVVKLDSLTDASLFPAAVADALGLWRQPGLDPVSDLIAAIGQQRMLLVLDNMEHLVAAAEDIDRLVSGCPLLSLLLTSRTPLQFSYERIFHVQPLQLPPIANELTSEGVVEFPALQHFIACANRSRPGFRVDPENVEDVVRICARLDGLPLALELAATRLRSTTPRALANDLDHSLPLLTSGARDLPLRQRTMSNAISWSYRLLPTDVQLAFRRLSIFPDTFSATAASAMLSDFDSPAFALDAMDSLVTSSLVEFSDSNVDESIYRMLQPVREFGRAALSENVDENASARRAHAAWCLKIIRPIQPGWYGVTQANWLDQVAASIADVRFALEWSFGDGDKVAGALLVSSLSGYWAARSEVVEGDRWLQMALALPRQMLESLPLADHLAIAVMSGSVRCWLGDYQSGLSVWEQCQNDPRFSGDHDALAQFATERSFILDYLDRQEESFQSAELAVDLARIDPVSPNLPNHIQRLSMTQFALGDLELAVENLTEALRLFRQANNEFMISYATNKLGLLCYLRGDLNAALPLLLESTELAIRMRCHWSSDGLLDCIADVTTNSGGAALAAQLHGASALAYHDSQTSPQPHNRDAMHRAATMARAVLGEDRFRELYLAGQQLSFQQALLMAHDSIAAIMTNEMPVRDNQSGLSERELEVLRLLVTGKTDQQIADMLFISRRTVNSHVATILRKLAASSRTEAVAVAMHNRLL